MLSCARAEGYLCRLRAQARASSSLGYLRQGLLSQDTCWYSGLLQFLC